MILKLKMTHLDSKSAAPDDTWLLNKQNNTNPVAKPTTDNSLSLEQAIKVSALNIDFSNERFSLVSPDSVEILIKGTKILFDNVLIEVESIENSPHPKLSETIFEYFNPKFSSLNELRSLDDAPAFIDPSPYPAENKYISNPLTFLNAKPSNKDINTNNITSTEETLNCS